MLMEHPFSSFSHLEKWNFIFLVEQTVYHSRLRRQRMLGNQMQGGLGTPGALSHAYVQHPPLRCDIPDTRGLFYDDANKFLIAPTADRVCEHLIS